MYLSLGGYPRRVDRQRGPLLRALGVGVAAVGMLTLAACGSASHPAAHNTGIRPGAGQSLAGTPGSTATGPASGASSTMPGMSKHATAGGAPAAAPVAGTAVTIKNFKFAPAVVTLKVGQTLTWTNQDGDAHTVTSTGSGGPLKSTALGTGKTYSYKFTKVGTYAYLCTIHPFMTATVTVTK